MSWKRELGSEQAELAVFAQFLGFELISVVDGFRKFDEMKEEAIHGKKKR